MKAIPTIAPLALFWVIVSMPLEAAAQTAEVHLADDSFGRALLRRQALRVRPGERPVLACLGSGAGDPRAGGRCSLVHAAQNMTRKSTYIANRPAILRIGLRARLNHALARQNLKLSLARPLCLSLSLFSGRPRTVGRLARPCCHDGLQTTHNRRRYLVFSQTPRVSRCGACDAARSPFEKTLFGDQQHDLSHEYLHHRRTVRRSASC